MTRSKNLWRLCRNQPSPQLCAKLGTAKKTKPKRPEGNSTTQLRLVLTVRSLKKN